MQKNSETFTTASTGTIIDVSDTPYSNFGIQVSKTGDVTSWNVVLEGSLDGTNFTTILTHTDLIQTNIILWGSTPTIATHYRIRCTSLVLGSGTNIIATVLAGRR